MVERLLSLKARLDTLLDSAFARNEQFVNSSKDALEASLNSRQNKPAECVAKFMDAKLRTGTKGLSEGEIEGQLDQAMALFRFINVRGGGGGLRLGLGLGQQSALLPC